MDKNSLIIIIVTAVVTATARALVSAIASWLKSSTMLATVKVKLIPWVNKHVLSIAIDCIAVSFITGIAVATFSGDGMAEKTDLLTLFALCFALVLFSTLLVFDILIYILHKALPAKP